MGWMNIPFSQRKNHKREEKAVRVVIGSRREDRGDKRKDCKIDSNSSWTTTYHSKKTKY